MLINLSLFYTRDALAVTPPSDNSLFHLIYTFPPFVAHLASHPPNHLNSDLTTDIPTELNDTEQTDRYTWQTRRPSGFVIGGWTIKR